MRLHSANVENEDDDSELRVRSGAWHYRGLAHPLRRASGGTLSEPDRVSEYQ
jgi:hypothetical protein